MKVNGSKKRIHVRILVLEGGWRNGEDARSRGSKDG